MTTGLLDPPPQPPQDHPLEAKALLAKDLPAGSQLEISDFSMQADSTKLIKSALIDPACPGSRLISR